MDDDNEMSDEFLQQRMTELEAALESHERVGAAIVEQIRRRGNADLADRYQAAYAAAMRPLNYYPGTSPVPEGVAVNVRGPSYKILADVEIRDPNCSGVMFKPEQKFVSPELKPGKYTLGMELTGQSAGQHGESVGTTRLYVNGNVVAEGPMKTQPGKFTLSGDGLCIGRDSGDNVS